MASGRIQQELAHEHGVDDSVISNIKTGKIHAYVGCAT